MSDDIDLNSIEFYQDPQGEMVVNPENNKAFTLTVKDREFIIATTILLENDYPEAWKGCREWNKKSKANALYYDFLCVRRFLKCNWAKFDGTLDIDTSGQTHFEWVECPLRGECKYENIICNPKFNSSLTRNDINLLRMIAVDNLTAEQIAIRVARSVNTINNRRKSIQHKTGCNTIAKLVAYWYQHNLI